MSTSVTGASDMRMFIDGKEIGKIQSIKVETRRKATPWMENIGNRTNEELKYALRKEEY